LEIPEGTEGLASTARPSHPPILDAPRRILAPAMAFLFYHSFYTLTRGSGQIILYCAHRTSTVSPCVFCEQEGWSGRSLLTLLRPRVARAKRPGARSASKEAWPLHPLLLLPSLNRIGKLLRGGGGVVLNCARPTRAFLGRALREQRGRPYHLLPAHSFQNFPIRLFNLP
jgi:hypothetical protein